MRELHHDYYWIVEEQDAMTSKSKIESIKPDQQARRMAANIAKLPELLKR